LEHQFFRVPYRAIVGFQHVPVINGVFCLPWFAILLKDIELNYGKLSHQERADLVACPIKFPLRGLSAVSVRKIQL
jgi:hypothetical protein